MIGHTVSHYKIVEKLGEGGMGVVYKAEDLKLKRFVALKFLPPHLVKDKNAREMFVNEAISASALDHPAICTVHEIRETPDGQYYIVMAYYEGTSLKKKIDHHGMDMSRAVSYAIDIAKGLAKAHSHGIVHRDIKPANILVTEDDQIKIVDFGLAKLAGEKHKTDEITSEGTTTYMSPEQIGAVTVDDRTDIWSLGVMLYEMVSGKYPFRGEYEQAIIYSILNEEPKPLHRLREDVPLPLWQIVEKALAKNPAERFQHMLEMLEELEKIQDILNAPAGTGKSHKGKAFLNKIYPYALSVLAAAIIVFVLRYLWPDTTASDKNAVLILPLKDLNPADSMEYFSDGVSEDIITQCSKISGLRVLSRKASMYYKNSPQTLETIGRQAGVDHILEGTIRRENDRIRIAVQLKTIESGEIRWAETFNRQLNDVFTLQSDVARRVAQALKVKLTSQDRKRLDQIYKADLPAYDSYMKGREYYYRYSESDMNRAILLFRRSLKQDKNFALAHAGLADAFAQRTLRFGLSPLWLDSARVHAGLALKINPELAEAYKALGVIYYTQSKFRDALAANRKALDYNPNHAPAMGNLGWTYLNLGDLAEAGRWLHEAVSRSPINPTITFGLGLLNLNLNQLDTAAKWFNTTLDLQSDHKPNPTIGLVMIDLIKSHPDSAFAKVYQILHSIKTDAGLYIAAGDAAVAMGNPMQAAEYYQSALERDPSSWNPITGVSATTSLGFILWKTGHTEEARQIFALSEQLDRTVEDQESEWWGSAYDLAAVNAIRGNVDMTLNLLQHAKERGFRLYIWLQIDPLFESMREVPDFRDMIKEMQGIVQKIGIK
jgi:serine/threonine protein kinase/Flp pilus assembly protein TadD